MSPEEYQCETCSFGLNGSVCSLHGVEVERRKNSDSLIRQLTTAVHDLGETVESLSSFKHIALGAAFLGTLMLSGAYYFTADTKADLSRVDVTASAKLEIISSQVSALTTAVAVTEARHSALLVQLESLNDLMRAQATKDGYKITDPRGTLNGDHYN